MPRIKAVVMLVLCSFLLVGLGCSSNNPVHSDSDSAVSNYAAVPIGGADGSAGGKGRNLVKNPGFELGLTFWNPDQIPSGWWPSGQNPRTGDYCLVFKFPDSMCYYDAGISSIGYELPVEAGVPYRFSYWVRETDAFDPMNPGFSVVKCLICIGGTCYPVVPEPFPSEPWQFVNRTIVFPLDGDARVKIEVHGLGYSKDSHIAVDDFMFAKK